MESLIKLTGSDFVIKTDTHLIPFRAILTANQTLKVTDKRLNSGELIHPDCQPENAYLIADVEPRGTHEEYRLLKVTNDAVVQRFSQEGLKDTFGRSIEENAIDYYTTVPLHLHSNTSASTDNSPDRTASAITYTFSAPSSFDLKVKDRLLISSSCLQITSLHLSGLEGLQEFSAVSLV
jgi:hypothetical protein